MLISLPHRRVFMIALAFSAVLLTIGATATLFAVCSSTSYFVTASAPPPSANWTSTSGLWQPSGGFPGCAPGDTASDTNGTPTTLIVNSAIPNPIAGLNLSCPGCMIDIQSGGSLTLAGTGTVGSSSSIIVEPGGTLTLANGSNLTFNSGTTFTVNGGYVDVQSGAQLTLNTSSTVTSSGTVNVSGTMTVNSTLAVNNGAQLTVDGATVNGSGTISNSGTLSESGSESTVSAVFNNNSGGNVHVYSGKLDFTGGGNGDAPFTVDSGAYLAFPAGTYTMTANGTVSGAGTLEVCGGTLSIGGVTSPTGYLMTAGTLTGAGFLAVDQMTWSGGTITGTGGAQLNGGGTGYFDGTSSDMILDGRAFNDYGCINYTATANSLYLANFATFSVYGTFDIQNDGSIEQGSAGGTFNVAPNGYLVKSGGSGTSTIYADFNNSATVYAGSGTLNIAGSGTSTGSFFNTAGTTLAFSASSSTLSGFQGGDGTYSFPAGSTYLQGTYTPTGITSITGGYLQIDASSQTTNFLETSGTLYLANDFTMTGTGTWSGGGMSGSATFDVASGATLTIDCATGITSVSGATLQNDGTVNYTAAANYLQLQNGTISNNGLFDIQTDQPINIAAIIAGSSGRAKTSAILIIGSSTITNNSLGTFQKSAGSGTTTIQPAFTNAGTVKALSGTMNFAGGFTQTAGETTLGPGGISSPTTLVFSGGVLDGAGTITGDVQNDANVSPAGTTATGAITITGNYTQGSTGVFTQEIGGTSSYDQVQVSGAATLDGTLNVSLINGFTPNNGDVFPVLTFASRTGDFAVKNLPTFNGTHGSFTATYTPTELDLIAVVTPNQNDLSAAMNGPSSVNAGAPLSYTITITNNGADATSGTTTVVDTLPAGVSGASASGTGWSCGAPSGGTITCTSTTIIAASSAYPTLTVTMTAAASGTATNNATVSNANDPTSTNNTATASTTIVPQIDLQITKSGPGGVTAGQNIVYTITVTNNGPSTATNVVVSDPTPANTTFVSNGGACTSAYPCNLGTFTAGQSETITSTYSTSGAFAGNISNTATVSGTEADPNSANNSSTASTNVGAQANLSITKNGPPTANAGQTITYTLNFSNAGPSPATNVVIADPTPVGIAFVSNTGACSTPFPCSIGTLASGQSASITSTYTIPPSYSGTSISNVATISATENDPNNTDNTSTATTSVSQPADVSITKTGPATATPGQNVTYAITVSNAGPASAANVVVNDATPSGTTFVSNTGACTTAFPCNLGTLAAGQSVTINATYSTSPTSNSASITNTATVTSAASDPNSGNNTSTAFTSLIAQADVSIVKLGPAAIAMGQNIVYTTTVTNNGPLAAANVFVTDPTPAGLTFVSNSGGCTAAFPCALGTIAAGQSVTITSTYSVPSNYTGTSVSNTASVSSSTFDGNTANNSSTATTNVTPPTPNADLQIVKTGPSEASAASTVTYNIVVTNLGPTSASTVTITDATPNGLVFSSMSGTSCTTFPCTVPSLAAGSQMSISAKYTVPSQTHGTVTNTAHVSSTSSDPNSANNTASTSMFVYPIVACPASAPTLTAPAANATVASPVTFTWNAVPNATGYILTITGGGQPPAASTTSATSLTVNLTSGNYSWSVTATGASRCVPPTSEARPLTVCNTPAAPTVSAVGSSTSGQTYSVQWNSLADATSYELQESPNADFSSITTFTLNGTSKTFTKNAAVTAAPFFYRVRAISTCGATSDFSRTVSVVVLPLPSPDDHNPNVAVPNGSKDPVTFQIRIPGLAGGTTSFVATVDKPWLTVTPSSGIVGPEGVLVTISLDPSNLTNGTWTGTILVVYGTSVVTSRAHTSVTTTTAIPVSISLVTPVTPAGFGTPSASALIIPSVGHIAGVDNSSGWRSDIRVANTTPSSLNYLLTFNPATSATNTVKQTTINVPSGATTALDDIVRNWFGAGALGDSLNGVLAIQQLAGLGSATSSLGSFVSSRIFNATPNGTFGQFMPATSFASFIGKGGTTLSLQQLAQSANFHTNLGLVEASGKPANALISVFNGAGNKLLDLPVTLAAGEQKQLNSFLAANGISLDNGRVEAKVISGDGQITAYASVVDNNTSDPLLVSGVPLGGAGSTRYIVPGVATLDTGVANWRSDVRIFNSGDAPQTTTLTLYPLGGGDAQTQSVTINPGEVKALDDVVHSTFGATNLAGALHVTTATASPLVVTARTYDQTSHGTVGQFVPAVTLTNAVGTGDRALQILQAEDSVRYRTNVGVAEVSGKPVTVEISVTLPDSRITPKALVQLGAFQSTQIPVLSSFGLSNTYNARISLRVVDGDGKVTGYGSVVDQTTQDATYVPAQ